MQGCPGCRYCKWLPAATQQLDGCPARAVTAALMKAVAQQSTSRKKRRRQSDEEAQQRAEQPTPADASAAPANKLRRGSAEATGPRTAGCDTFCAEFNPAVLAADPALLDRAGGVRLVLGHMWAALPASRQAAYAAFEAAEPDSSELDAVTSEAAGATDATNASSREAMLSSSGSSGSGSGGGVEYFSASENWKDLSTLFKSDAARELWLPPMCQMWLQRRGRAQPARDLHAPDCPAIASVVTELLSLPGSPGTAEQLLPSHLEASDWRHSARQCADHRRQGPHSPPDPEFWGWVCEGACHALAPLFLWVAQQAEPSAAWRIVTCDAHSTIWDGKRRLFDPNFEAMGIEPAETFRRASAGQQQGGPA
jgi:hypothetical protein